LELQLEMQSAKMQVIKNCIVVFRLVINKLFCLNLKTVGKYSWQHVNLCD